MRRDSRRADRPKGLPATVDPASEQVLHLVNGKRQDCVAPPADAGQAQRQAGRHGDRATPVERHHVPAARSVPRHRPVAGEQLRVRPPQPQGPRHHQQLRRAIGVDRGPPAVVQTRQHLPAYVEVDRAAVVGVDERVVPQLGALVGVRHPGHRELHQLLPERVAPAGRGDRRREFGQLVVQARVVVHQVDHGVQRLLEGQVRVRPTGRGRRFPGGLLDVRVQPLPFDRPRADGGLPQQVGEGRVGQRSVLHPGRDLLAPALRQLAEHGEAGPHVLAAFGVVGGEGGHAHRPADLPGGGEAVELRRRHPEVGGAVADLVQRDEPTPPVERGVLDALGHHSAGELREAASQLVVGVAQPAGDRVQGDGQVGSATPGLRAGGGEVLVGVRRVAPVDGERGGQLGERGSGLLGRHLGGEHGQPGQLGGEQSGGGGQLGLVGQVLPGGVVPDEAGVQHREVALRVGVDEEPADCGESVVAGRAVHRPVRQLLPVLQDLLHHEPGLRRGSPQPGQVAGGVAQAVRVVDADAVDLPVGGPAQDQLVGGGEHRRVLHAQPGQAGNGKEPAVRQLGVTPTPGDQLVVLPVVHLPRAAVAGAVGDREAVLVVAQLPVDQLEVVQGRRVVGQHRQQQPAPVPVDVKPVGVRRVAPPAQHVPPGRVGRRHRDTGVVGHDVDDQPELLVAQRAQQPLPSGLTAQLGVDRPVVDHVVAVRGAGGGGQQRGAVEVADAEVGEVVEDPGGGVQVEAGADLHAVRGPDGVGLVGRRLVGVRGHRHVRSSSPTPRGNGPAPGWCRPR